MMFSYIIFGLSVISVSANTDMKQSSRQGLYNPEYKIDKYVFKSRHLSIGKPIFPNTRYRQSKSEIDTSYSNDQKPNRYKFFFLPNLNAPSEIKTIPSGVDKTQVYGRMPFHKFDYKYSKGNKVEKVSKLSLPNLKQSHVNNEAKKNNIVTMSHKSETSSPNLKATTDENSQMLETWKKSLEDVITENVKQLSNSIKPKNNVIQRSYNFKKKIENDDSYTQVNNWAIENIKSPLEAAMSLSRIRKLPSQQYKPLIDNMKTPMQLESYKGPLANAKLPLQSLGQQSNDLKRLYYFDNMTKHKVKVKATPKEKIVYNTVVKNLNDVEKEDTNPHNRPVDFENEVVNNINDSGKETRDIMSYLDS